MTSNQRSVVTHNSCSIDGSYRALNALPSRATRRNEMNDEWHLRSTGEEVERRTSENFVRYSFRAQGESSPLQEGIYFEFQPREPIDCRGDDLTDGVYRRLAVQCCGQPGAILRKCRVIDDSCNS